MTTTAEPTVHPRSVTLGLEIEQQVHDIGTQAATAVDEIFRKVTEHGWRFQSRCGGDPEEIDTYVGERLEYQASTVVREQASAAILGL